MIFIPTWCAAKAVVPSRATIIAYVKKPKRKKSCSASEDEPMSAMERSVFLRKRSISREIFKCKNAPGCDTE